MAAHLHRKYSEIETMARRWKFDARHTASAWQNKISGWSIGQFPLCFHWHAYLWCNAKCSYDASLLGNEHLKPIWTFAVAVFVSRHDLVFWKLLSRNRSIFLMTLQESTPLDVTFLCWHCFLIQQLNLTRGTTIYSPLCEFHASFSPYFMPD